MKIFDFKMWTLLLVVLISFSCGLSAQKVIGKIDKDRAVLTYDTNKVNKLLISKGYTSVESNAIKVEDGQAALHIIVKNNSNTRELLLTKLEVSGVDVLFPNPKNNASLMTTHSCSGDPCSNCDFTGTFNIGCKCVSGQANGKCNHTITNKLLLSASEFYEVL